MFQNAKHKMFQFCEWHTLGMLEFFYFFEVNLVESYKLHYKNEGNSASFKSRP
jgi:hypothetical protein